MNDLNLQIEHYLPLLNSVLESDNSKYIFTSQELHLHLVKNGDLASANRIYVSEILYRLHASSLITLRRNLLWIDSIKKAIHDNSFFVLCTSLRAFIESSADSFYSLRYVPQNLGKYFQIIKDSIDGKEDKRINLFKELEDWGIHFLEAGTYEDKTLPKEHFKAKPTWEYLKAIDTESVLKPVYPMYQDLCQITHPSRETTYLFFKQNDFSWSVREANQSDLINTTICKYDKEYEEIFQKCLNSSLIILWLIEELKLENVSTPYIKAINFEAIQEFKKVKKLVSN